jgi:uncharacterized repeat protein (TIGR01451 family)
VDESQTFANDPEGVALSMTHGPARNSQSKAGTIVACVMVEIEPMKCNLTCRNLCSFVNRNGARENHRAALEFDHNMRHVAPTGNLPGREHGSRFQYWFVLGLLLLLTAPSALAQRQFLQGHVPRAAAHSKPVGKLDISRHLEVLIGLPLQNRQALTNLLNDLYDPASPSYHQFLTPAQFAERFGPTQQDYDAVAAFARSNRLNVLHTFPNRTMLAVDGSVADIQKTLHVQLNLYQHPTEKRTFFAPDAEPSLDLAVPVLAISGLDNYVVPHPLCHPAARSHPATPLSGTAPSGNYWGTNFRTAYVPGTTLTGAGQKVGLFELDDFYTSDIQSYEGDSGLSNVPLTRITVDGYVSGSPGSDSDEVSLDIEMAISMAPALSGVIIYEGPNLNNYTAPDMVLNCMATNDAAKQLSCSWVFNIDATTVQTFQQFVAQGQSFFQASGDSGAYPGSPDPPTDDPYITSVGGTTLTTSSSGAWQSEKVWSWFPGQQYASSGGISSSNPIPSWQAPVSMASNQGSTTMRNLPDVALTADNVWVLYGGGQSGEYGGTSCAAPLWAGFTALVNQQAAINRRPPVGFLNPAFYALGLGTNYTTAFHDITSGNNTNLSSPNKFYAVPGYDLCTGWGTPNGTSMINALAPPATNPIISASAILTAESCLPTNGVMDPGETVTVNLMLTNLSPVATTNLVATLQAGSAVLQPTGPQYYGALVQGSNAVTLPFTFTANGACGQAISLVWQLQDGAANLGSITFNDNLGTLVAATTFTQNFDSVTIPALPAGWSSSVTGSQVNWVTINSNDDTPPNSVFAKDVPAAGVAYLYSPAIAIFSTNAQLTFRQDYLLAYHVHKSGSVTYYDGGVLDIAIGSGGFNDILSSGGSFVSGGYVGSLYSASGNPLAGREAWSGSSGGWITTVVNLPATAAGQNIQLRWDCATGSQNTYTGSGWAVDTISLKDAYYSCCNDSANLSVSQSEAPAQFSIGLNGVYTITLTNSGPDLAADVVVMDTLPPSVAFVSASPGGACNNGVVTFPLGSISSGGAATMNITVQPGQTGAITNTVTISTVTPPSGTGNATAVNITMVVNPQPITIVSGSLAVVPGSGLAVSVNSVSGWNYTLVYKNSLNDPAWTPLPASTVAGTGGVITLQDTSPAQSQRFYLILAN